jgi:hypothetical protein
MGACAGHDPQGAAVGSDGALWHHAVQHHRGVLVEQVRVVNGRHQHQRPLQGRAGPRARQMVSAALPGRDVEQAGERTQRGNGRAAVDPDDVRTPARRTASALRASRVLPTPIGARRHDPRCTAPDRRCDPAQLHVPAGERLRPLYSVRDGAGRSGRWGERQLDAVPDDAAGALGRRHVLLAIQPPLFVAGLPLLAE